MSFCRRVFTVAASALLLAGCITGERPSFSTEQVVELGPLPSLDGPIAPNSVVVIGDSITEASADVIRYVLTGSGVGSVTVDGLSSRRIAVGNGTSEPLSGAAVLAKLLAAGAAPDAWVIALGTNDVGNYPNAEAYGELIDEMLAQIPSTTPVVWIDTYLPERLAQTEQFNAVVRAKMGVRGNSVVGSWLAAASQPDTDLLRSDNVHPNGDGLIAFAAVIANALAQVR